MLIQISVAAVIYATETKIAGSEIVGMFLCVCFFFQCLDKLLYGVLRFMGEVVSISFLLIDKGSPMSVKRVILFK